MRGLRASHGTSWNVPQQRYMLMFLPSNLVFKCRCECLGGSGGDQGRDL